MKTLRTLLAASLLALCSPAVADDYAYLTIGQTDGQTSYAVSQISKITFDTNYMVLHLSDGTTERLELQTLSRMFFSADGTGIATIEGTADKIQVDGGWLRLCLDAGERATVYTLKGEPVFQSATSTEYNIGSLQRGVYIVRVGTQTKKVMSR